LLEERVDRAVISQDRLLSRAQSSRLALRRRAGCFSSPPEQAVAADAMIG